MMLKVRRLLPAPFHDEAGMGPAGTKTANFGATRAVGGAG